MLKVAIVGCGKIADAHLSQIRRIKGCRVVAACDREILMARQLSERFQIDTIWTDVAEMLATVKPDVVHVTTPPTSHYEVGIQCLSGGHHVYMEKPFTLDQSEAKHLIDLAAQRGCGITVGHDLQFSPVARRMRRLVKDGYLGGDPVHMESYYCYDLSDPVYAKALLADREHWVRKLPGGLLQNIISHGIARIAEYLQTDAPSVVARGVTSPLLRSLGEQNIVDELRVLISEEGRTAYFTFSSQMRPSLNHFRVYGPKNGCEIDEDQQTLIRIKGTRLKSFAERFIPPLGLGRQFIQNWFINVRKFLANDFHMKSGLKYLIEAFYQSVAKTLPPPIPAREILLTARIMDEIFAQIATKPEVREEILVGRESS